MNAELEEPIVRDVGIGASPSPTWPAFQVASDIDYAAAAKASDRSVPSPGVSDAAKSLAGAATSPVNASAPELATGPGCLWTPLSDYSGDWKTGCGREWNSLGGTEEPRQGMRCFGCGRPVALPTRPHA